MVIIYSSLVTTLLTVYSPLSNHPILKLSSEPDCFTMEPTMPSLSSSLSVMDLASSSTSYCWMNHYILQIKTILNGLECSNSLYFHNYFYYSKQLFKFFLYYYLFTFINVKLILFNFFLKYYKFY